MMAAYADIPDLSYAHLGAGTTARRELLLRRVDIASLIAALTNRRLNVDLLLGIGNLVVLDRFYISVDVRDGRCCSVADTVH